TRMLALRVPCDAQSSRRDMKLAALRQHIPKSPAQSALLGKPERDGLIKDMGLKTKDKRKIKTVFPISLQAESVYLKKP
ncbi:MAG: hypothetical protein ACN4GR_06235, partial [Arenicellales bacterium]